MGIQPTLLLSTQKSHSAVGNFRLHVLRDRKVTTFWETRCGCSVWRIIARLAQARRFSQFSGYSQTILTT
eukprot:m.416222 g.416222  ORF g.416222 m.416222 type:complete len:70 (-) comp16830_c1_seq1:1994-2203(-)